MGPLSNCVFLQLILTAFSAVLAQPLYPLKPVFQTLATLTNQSDCWLCQHLDNAEESEVVFVPASVSTWWTVSGQWMYEEQSASSSGSVTWHWEISRDLQGLSFIQVRLLEENFSLCIENKNGNGPFLGNIPEQYCNQTLLFDSTEGIFKPSIDVIYRSKSDYYNVNVCLVIGQYSWFSDHTNGTWSSSAVPLVRVPDTKDYKWIDQNSGMTWSGNDTHLYSCPNRAEGLLYQIFRNLFCSSSMTEARGNWRCVAANRANDRGREGYQASTQQGMGSTLSLSINNSGLFILCGNKLYKEFPPKWAGRCGLGYLAPSVTKYSALNASQITNLGSFIHKVAPRSRIQRDAIGIPPTYRKTSLASIISSLGAEQQEKAIQGISKIMEKELMATRQILEARQSGVNWDSVLQSPSYLERQATEQRSCAVVGKQCCLYVNKSGIVHAKINRLQELAKQPKSFAWISGMGDWLNENWSYVLVFGFFCLLVPCFYLWWCFQVQISYLPTPNSSCLSTAIDKAHCL